MTCAESCFATLGWTYCSRVAEVDEDIDLACTEVYVNQAYTR